MIPSGAIIPPVETLNVTGKTCVFNVISILVSLPVGVNVNVAVS